LNYAAILFSTLNAEEIDKILSEKWGVRENELLTALLNSSSNNKKVTHVTAETLSISQTHFDKLCSIVVEKIYNILTSGSFSQVAAFLQLKGLSQLLLHEIKINHRRIKTDKSARKQKEFYTTAFETLRRLSFDLLDLKLLRQYANELKPLLKNGEPFSPTVLEYKFVYIENAFHFLNGEGLRYAAKAHKNIINIAPHPTKQKDVAAISYYHFCMAGYVKDFTDNQDEALFHAQKALETARTWAPGKDDAFLASVYGITATILSHKDDFNAAYNLYSEAFERLPKQMRSSYYQLFMFASIAMICGDYEMTEQLIQTNMKSYMESSASLYYRIETKRLYALLLLYKRRYDEALSYIRDLQSIKRKDMTDTADIFLRMMDNMYLLLTGEYELAISQTRKNLKYLSRKNYTYDNCDYNHLFYTIGALAKMKLNSKVDVAALEPHLSLSKRGFMKTHGGLFDLVLK
jgi:tetratricopeptide (TPR) repeat protein